MVTVHLHDLAIPGNQRYFPLEEIITTYHEPIREILINEAIIKKSGDIKLDDICYLSPLEFKSLYPNKREYWEGPSQKFSLGNRTSAFMCALDKPGQFQVLVTQAFNYNGRISFTAPIPFYLDSPQRVIELFMSNADWPVDERAKYSAIYSMDNPVAFNHVTGTIENDAPIPDFDNSPGY